LFVVIADSTKMPNRILELIAGCAEHRQLRA
jgi:hypothetical protein